MMELEAERISPTFTSRYMSNYMTNTASPTDIYHQNYHSPRQNMQSFYPVLENDRSYLKRHYFVKDEMEGEEREKKYEKLIDHHSYPHAYHTNELYDTYNNNTLYPEPPLERSTTADSNSIILTNTNSNDNYPINSSPASSIEDASEKITDSPKSVASGKKTKGRVKIKMEYIENKLRRYTTFSKRKTGIMKKVRVFLEDSNSESHFAFEVSRNFLTLIGLIKSRQFSFLTQSLKFLVSYRKACVAFFFSFAKLTQSRQ